MEEWLLGLTASAWVLPMLFAFCAVDGFFPPIPSESAVIALGAVSVATGRPELFAVIAAASAGAFTGDQIAFTLGRRLDPSRISLFRSGRGEQALARMAAALHERGASVVVSARFVPIGRVAANVAAGSTGFPRRRFVVADAIAAIVWTVYGVLLGGLAAAWLREHPLLAVVVGIGVGLAIGLAVDRLATRRGPLGA